MGTSRERAIKAYADWKFAKNQVGHGLAEMEAGMVFDAAHAAGHIVWADEHERRLGHLTDLLREVAQSGVSLQDPGLKYVEVQIDVDTWDAIRELADDSTRLEVEGTESKPGHATLKSEHADLLARADAVASPHVERMYTDPHADLIEDLAATLRRVLRGVPDRQVSTPTSRRLAAEVAQRREVPCNDRGPRIGNEGAMYCVLPKGHKGEHQGDPSWRQHGWSNLSDDTEANQ